MIVLIVTVALIPVAVVAAIILEPHVESWATRKALSEAHRNATEESAKEPMK